MLILSGSCDYDDRGECAESPDPPEHKATSPPSSAKAKVYVISSQGTPCHVSFNRARGEFKVVCEPPCRAVTFFQKHMLKPYAVTNKWSDRGYGAIKECKPLSVQ
jgi:hypothetical protein